MKKNKKWLLPLLSLLTALSLTFGAALGAEGNQGQAEGTPFSLSDDFRTDAVPHYTDSLHVSNTKGSHGLLPTDSYGTTFGTTTGWIVYRLTPAEGMFETLKLNVSGVVWGGNYEGGENNAVNLYAGSDGREWGTALYTQKSAGHGASTFPFTEWDLTGQAAGRSELYVKIELAHVEVNTSPTYCGIKLMTIQFTGTTVPDGTQAMTPVSDHFGTSGERSYAEASGVKPSGSATHGMVPSPVWGDPISAGTGYIVYKLELPNEGTFKKLLLDMTARVSWTNQADLFRDNRINVYASTDNTAWGEPLFTQHADASYSVKNLSADLSAFARDKSLVYVKIELVHAPGSVSLTYTGVKLFTVTFTGKYLPGLETLPYEVNYELDGAGLAGLDKSSNNFERYGVDGADYTYCTGMTGEMVKKFSADEAGLLQFHILKLRMRTRVTVYGNAAPTEGALKIWVSPDGEAYTLVDSVDSDRDWAIKSREWTLSQTVRGWKDVYVKLEFSNPNANSGDWTSVGNLELSGGTVERSSYDILYHNVQGAEHANPASYDRGTALNLEAAARAGYDFAGWYGDESLATPFAGITAETRGDVHVYAKWTPKTFTILLDPNGGAFADGESHSLTGTYDAAIDASALPADPVMEGMDFVGWFSDAACTQQWVFGGGVGTPTIVDGSVLTLYAKYAAERVTVTFRFNDGATADSAVVCEKGQSVSKPADPVRAGYVFGGWFDGDQAFDFSTPLTQSLLLDARWHKISRITYEGLEDGTHANPPTYVEGRGLTLAEAERTGYDFGGWFDNAACTGNAVTALDASSAGDKTLYAKWTVREYRLTVQASNAQVLPGDAEVIPYTGMDFEVEIASGYFLGEVTVNDSPVRIENSRFRVEGIDADVVIVVSALRRHVLSEGYQVDYTAEENWQARVYESYGLRRIPSDSEREGWLQVTPYDEVYRGGYLVYRLDAGEGKTFNTVKVSGYARVFSYQDSAAALKLSVRTDGSGDWTLVKDFESTTSGELYTTISESLTTFVKGKQVVEIKLEMESGFTDWVCLRNLGIETAYSTVIVKFYDGEEQLGTNAKQIKGGVFLPLTPTPEKAGFEFAGWFLDRDCKTPAEGQVISSACSVYAKWRTITYTITYLGTEGAEHANPESYTVRDAFSMEAARREGHKFLGWYESEDFSGDAVTAFASGTTGNRTLYAKWLRGEAIVYELDGGTNAEENPSVYFGDEETALADAVREGYTFAGWYADEARTELVTAIEEGTAGTVTLYAKWIQNAGEQKKGCGSVSGLPGGGSAAGLFLLCALCLPLLPRGKVRR